MTSTPGVDLMVTFAPKAEPPPLRRSFMRPADLLVVDFEFINLRLESAADGPKLVRQDPSGPAFLLVHFPPQSFAEQSFQEVSDGPNDSSELDPLIDPPVRGRISGPSQLAFRVPSDVDSIEYALVPLLEACRTWEPNVVPVALSVTQAPVGSTNVQKSLSDDMAAVKAELRADAVELVSRHVKNALRYRLGVPLSEEVVRLSAPDTKAVVVDAVRAAVNDAALAVSELGGKLLNEVAIDDIMVRGVGQALHEVGALVTGIGRLYSEIPGLVLYLRPTRPSPTATAIELPYRLFISPNRHARWVHADGPVTRGGASELWHTRLGILSENDNVTEAEHLQRAVRAIWSPDYRPVEDPELPLATHGLPEQGDPGGVTQALVAKNRRDLVRLTSDFTIVDPDTKTAYAPTPVRARGLMLSALGGWLDVDGMWPDRPELIDLDAWRHRTAMGRDGYVRVIEKGYLCGFEHDAVRIRVTERRFLPKGDRRVAYLRTREFVVVRRPVVTYPRLDTAAGRRFPFRSVEVLTLVTPNLDPTMAEPSGVDPSNDSGVVWNNGDVFWPMVDGQPFDFKFVAEDWAGRRVPFSAPALFVMGSVVAAGKAEMSEVIARYEDHLDRRTAELEGQAVRYAESLTPGDTDLETESISVSAAYEQRPKGQPDFRAVLAGASIRVPALQRLLGDDTAVPVAFPADYWKNGLGSSEVFLETVGSAPTVAFAGLGKGDTTGGLISPDLSLAGLSRKTGPVGGADVTKAMSGQFDPNDFFSGAKLFGSISLADILDVAPADPPPRLTVAETANGTVTSYTWSTTKFAQHDLFVAKGGELSVETTISSLPPEPAKAETLAELTKFDVNLFGFVVIPFARVRFHARPNEKPDTDVELAGRVEFGGALEFVNVLREYIPAAGFSDPPELAVSPSGIVASYDLDLPSIGVGIFSLENLSLGAGFELPFDSRPMVVRFNFAERHDTFTITVSAFGGGGFLALELNAGGVVAIEGALEFGGKLALDIGVASGGVYVKAGIYFAWAVDQTTGGEAVCLTGYVEAGGSLEVLGLISVSLVFHLSLTYTSNGKVWGQATLYVEVEIAFISETVELTVEKQFAGSKGDPSFAELMPTPEIWTAYCQAFAEEAA